VRLLIAGCGYVGSALGVHLAGAGHTVYGLRRDPSGLPAELHPLAADLTDRPSLVRNMPDGLQAVVYAASPSAPTDEGYANAYVRGLTHVLDVLVRRGDPVERVLLTTSTAVYAQQGGEWVDESSPTEPAHFSGRRLLEAEALLAASPFRTVALRLAGIYGPGRTGLLRRVRDGTARLPAQPRFTNRIHRDDCAGMLAHLIDLPDPGPVYVGVDDAPADMAEVMLWLARRLGVPAPRPEDAEKAPSGRRARTHKRCSNALIKAHGYRLRMPSYRDGYEALVAGITAT
jgi:nucleoside-diphosphate-sugar epimerase